MEIARAFIEHGAAGIDVSSGQVTKDERPAFGRSYQTPFADRIRHEVAAPAGVAVIAVGAISSYDDVNSILLAGPCRPVRPRPHAPVRPAVDAARRRRAGVPRRRRPRGPTSSQAGRRKPPTARTDKVPPRLSLLRAASDERVHIRWTPSPALTALSAAPS